MIVDGAWWDVSKQFVGADIVFCDAGDEFFTGNSQCSGGVYLDDVATHEFGHALGLGHSSVVTATMAPSVTICTQT
jgi:predicted Zn-dependent protease